MKNKHSSLAWEAFAYGYLLVIVLLSLVNISNPYLSDLVYSYKLNIYIPAKFIALIFIMVFAIHIIKMLISQSNNKVITSLLLSELSLTLILNKLILIQFTGLIIDQNMFLKIPANIFGVINMISTILMLVGIIIVLIPIGKSVIRFVLTTLAILSKPKIEIGPVEVPVPSIDMNKQSILPALIITLIVFGLMFYLAYDLYQIIQDNSWQPMYETSEY